RRVGGGGRVGLWQRLYSRHDLVVGGCPYAPVGSGRARGDHCRLQLSPPSYRRGYGGSIECRELRAHWVYVEGVVGARRAVRLSRGTRGLVRRAVDKLGQPPAPFAPDQAPTVA